MTRDMPVGSKEKFGQKYYCLPTLKDGNNIESTEFFVKKFESQNAEYAREKLSVGKIGDQIFPMARTQNFWNGERGKMDCWPEKLDTRFLEK